MASREADLFVQYAAYRVSYFTYQTDNENSTYLLYEAHWYYMVAINLHDVKGKTIIVD